MPSMASCSYSLHNNNCEVELGKHDWSKAFQLAFMPKAGLYLTVSQFLVWYLNK